MFLGMLVIASVYLGAQLLVQDLLLSFSLLPQAVVSFMVDIVSGVLAVLAYLCFYGFYEHREVHELSGKTMGLNLFFGSFWGTLLQGMTILVIYFFGQYSILAVNRLEAVIPAFSLAFTAAMFEEVICRGVILRLLEEKLGTYFALFLSSGIFGLMHLANPNSSVWISITLAVQAGLLLGAAYVYTKNLWFPIAIHLAWNFVQAGIFGAVISGNRVKDSLFVSRIDGSDWITGGSFGPEASVQATFFCLATAVFLLILSRKNGRILKPQWKRGN